MKMFELWLKIAPKFAIIQHASAGLDNCFGMERK